MLPSDLSAETTTDDLWRAYDANCEPWESLAQCDLFLRAAAILRRRLPAEVEGAGERLTLRDLDDAMRECRKHRGVFALGAAPVQVPVPPDALR